MNIKSLMICLLLIPSLVFAWGEEEDVGNITGKLMLNNGQPMSGAIVFLFDAASGPAPMLGKFWRVPDVISETDDAGEFNIQTKPGRYYLGAVKRMSASAPMGPPVNGDYVFPSHEDEIRGKQKAFRITKWDTTNIGTIKGIITFDPAKHLYRGPVTSIEGIVLLPDNKPAEHAIVFAYDNAEMSGSPKYASDPSDKDGKYVLKLGKGGRYYLRVRGGYGGGRPVAGSITGGGVATGVNVTLGKTVKGINITGAIFSEYGDKAK